MGLYQSNHQWTRQGKIKDILWHETNGVGQSKIVEWAYLRDTSHSQKNIITGNKAFEWKLEKQIKYDLPQGVATKKGESF